MKKVFFFSAIAALVFNSCDSINKLDDVTIPTDYTTSYSVETTNDSINMNQIFDITSDEDVKKVKDKIKGVTLDKLELSVTEYVGVDGNKLNGSLLYSEATSSYPLLLSLINNLALVNGTTITLSADQTKLTAIQNILLEKKSIKVYLKGKTTGAASFTLKAKFYFTIKANVL